MVATAIAGKAPDDASTSCTGGRAHQLPAQRSSPTHGMAADAAFESCFTCCRKPVTRGPACGALCRAALRLHMKQLACVIKQSVFCKQSAGQCMRSWTPLTTSADSLCCYAAGGLHFNDMSVTGDKRYRFCSNSHATICRHACHLAIKPMPSGAHQPAGERSWSMEGTCTTEGPFLTCLPDVNLVCDHHHTCSCRVGAAEFAEA
jgi:hypothetical protein